MEIVLQKFCLTLVGVFSIMNISTTQLSQQSKDALLEEARAWTDAQQVNWSRLARKYGISARNGGQSIKEFLRSQEIRAAKKDGSNTKSSRRKRKRLPEGIPFPMPRPSGIQKERLNECSKSGDVTEGVALLILLLSL